MEGDGDDDRFMMMVMMIDSKELSVDVMESCERRERWRF
jgi:hypothetical protein